MLKLTATLCLFLASATTFAQLPSGQPEWFYFLDLTDGRVSVLSNGYQEDKFDCTFLGILTKDDFRAHFVPNGQGPYAKLVTKKMPINFIKKEELSARDCVDWGISDGGPEHCEKFSTYEYRFTKIFAGMTFSETAALNIECSNFKRGAEKVQK